MVGPGALGGLGGLLAPSPATAHASEQAFVLLLPTDMMVGSGTLAVVASMLLVALLPAKALTRLWQPLALPFRLRGQPGRWRGVLAALVVALLLAIGVFGPPDPAQNLLSLTFWTLLWAAAPVALALLGTPRLWPHQRPPPLPERGSIGAVVLALVIGLWAIAAPAPEDPRALALVIGSYATFAFALRLQPNEPFSLIARMLGTLAPLACLSQRCYVGLPGWRLARYISGRQPSLAAAIMACLFLAVGSFDGLKETFWWMGWIGVNPLAFPGRSAVITSSLLGAAGFTACLLLALATASALGARIVKQPNATCALFKGFSLSLLPIAVGYHAAHFMISLMINLQYIPLALTDPLANGRDLLALHRDHHHASTGFLNTRESVRVIWLTQAGIVVFSHILGVLLAHSYTARHIPGPQRNIALVQAPFAALMAAYTFFGLWLLAAPRAA